LWENGEFHTFTFDGPIFKSPLILRLRNRVSQYEKPKESSSNTACDTDTSDAFDFGFWYCDLIENNGSHKYEVQETMEYLFYESYLISTMLCSIFSMSNLSFSERLS
jgi:hypothetical protein